MSEKKRCSGTIRSIRMFGYLPEITILPHPVIRRVYLRTKRTCDEKSVSPLGESCECLWGAGVLGCLHNGETFWSQPH
jgi:hypothetical protein